MCPTPCQVLKHYVEQFEAQMDIRLRIAVYERQIAELQTTIYCFPEERSKLLQLIGQIKTYKLKAMADHLALQNRVAEGKSKEAACFMYTA